MANKINTQLAITADGKVAVGEINKVTETVRKSSGSVDTLNKKLSSINVAAKITAIASAMSVVGSVIGGIKNVVGTVIGAVDGFASKADTIAKFSRNVGLSTTDLQKWQYAAERSGMSTDQFNNSIRKFSSNVSKAANGEKTQLDIFNALGVSLHKSNGELKSNNDLMMEVADAYKKVGNAQDRIRISEELFGRGSTGMGNLFEGGSAGVQALLDRRARIGGMFSEDDAKNAEEFKDLMQDVNTVVEGIKTKFISEILPSLNEGFKQFLDWWDGNSERVMSNIKIAADVLIYNMQDLAHFIDQALEVFANLPLVWDGLKITFGEFATSIKDFFTENVIDPISNFFTQTIPDFVGGIASAVGNVFANIKNSILSAVASVADSLSGLPFVGDKFAGVASGIRDSISPAQAVSPAGAAAVSSYTETRNTKNTLDVNFNGLPKEATVTPAPGFNFGAVDYTAGYAF